MDEATVHELVGELLGDLASVGPNDEDFLVDVAWAQALVKAALLSDATDQAGPHIHVNDDVWAAEDGADGDVRMHVTAHVNGVPCHLEAWPVKEGVDPQELDGPFPDDLDALCEIYSPDGHFRTINVRGRECIVVMFPHGG